MRLSATWLLLPLLGQACGGHAGQRSGAAQAPIRSACAKGATSIAELGLVTRTEFSGDAQAKVVLENAGARPRRVAPEMVAICRGPCDGQWTSCKRHRRFTEAERARYDVMLAAGESIELLVDARQGETDHPACEKLGLFLIADVDRTKACTDVGTWISLSES